MSAKSLGNNPLLTCDLTELGRLGNAEMLNTLAVVVLAYCEPGSNIKSKSVLSVKPISLPTVEYADAESTGLLIVSLFGLSNITIFGAVESRGLVGLVGILLLGNQL
jgi:hypothetical protein